jgi:hypothetical protein
MYSLVTGAAATGVNRSTILRAIKAGKLSAEWDGSGAWAIQPAELQRLFPPLPQLPAVVEPVQNAGHDTEVALLRTTLEEMRETITDLRTDRDHWREVHQSTLRLLPAPKPEDAQDAHWLKRAWKWSRGR